MKKPNEFDYFIIICIILIIVALYIFGFQKDSSDIESPSTITEGVITVELNDLLENLVKSIAINDELLSYSSKSKGYITNISIFDSKIIDAIDGNIISTSISGYKRVILTISIQMTQYGPYLDFNGQEIKCGLDFKINGPNYSLDGKIMSIEIKE